MKLFTRNLRKALIPKSSRSIEKGQSLVEMSFGLIVTLMILSGLVDIGRAYYTYVALEDAAGEAAMYMVLFPDCPADGYVGGDEVNGAPLANATGGDDTTPGSGVTGCEPPNNATWRAQEAATGVVEWTNVTTIYLCDPGPCGTSAGETVEVTLTYPFRLISPLIPDITGEPTLMLTAYATQTILNE